MGSNGLEILLCLHNLFQHRIKNVLISQGVINRSSISNWPNWFSFKGQQTDNCVYNYPYWDRPRIALRVKHQFAIDQFQNDWKSKEISHFSPLLVFDTALLEILLNCQSTEKKWTRGVFFLSWWICSISLIMIMLWQRCWIKSDSRQGPLIVSQSCSYAYDLYRIFMTHLHIFNASN